MGKYYHTFHGLIRKRKRLAVELEATRRQMMDIRRELSVIDKTLVLFGHDNPKAIRTPAQYNRLFKRNELSKLIRSITGDNPNMTDSKDIAREIIRIKGWDSDSEILLNMVFKRVSVARCALARQKPLKITV